MIKQFFSHDTLGDEIRYILYRVDISIVECATEMIKMRHLHECGHAKYIIIYTAVSNEQTYVALGS